MHVCHLTSVHSTYDIRIFHKECVSLAKKYKVTLCVINGEDSIKNNVQTINIPVNYTNRLQRFTKAVDALFDKALEINADVYHLHDPELLRIAPKLKKHGKKVIYDAHEDLPRQLMAKPYLNKAIAKILSFLVEKYENSVVSKIDGVITTTPHIAKRFRKINNNTIDINNFPLLSELEKIDKFTATKHPGWITYIGGITTTRGINEMLETVNLLKGKVKLQLAGKFFPANLEKEVNQHSGWQHVSYYGFLNRLDIIKLLAQSSVGLLILHPATNIINSLPIKMFEYMAAGLPVIASKFPLWQEIIEKNNCGICVNPLNINEIAKSISFLIENPKKAIEMGQNGKKLVLEKYNWTNEEKKLFNFYKKL